MVEVPWPCAAASAASTSARLVCDFEPGTVTVACTGVGAHGAVHVLTGPSLPVGRRSATMGVMCGRFAVTTDPALLAEKIKAIDEATGASERARGAQLQRGPHHDHRDRGDAGTPSPTTSRPAGCG